jgi:hypothetical protein
MGAFKSKELTMPKFYVFKKDIDSTLMVTADKAGDNLPKQPLDSWIFFKEVNFSEGSKGNFGASDDEVIDAVIRVGYYKC